MVILRSIAIANWVFGFTGALLMAQKGIAATIIALRFLKIAIMTNPMGLILTAIASAVTLVLFNWEKVKKWFVDFFDMFKS
jgi:hypothetical protein